MEKAAGAFVREKGVSQKLSLEKLKGLYQEDDVVMGEILASEKADGLTIEESFFLYILAQTRLVPVVARLSSRTKASRACKFSRPACISTFERRL